MMSFSDDKQADIIDASITTSRCLDDIWNKYNTYLDNIVSKIYPTELQLNKANTSDTAACFFYLLWTLLMIEFLSKFMTNLTICILSITHFRW